MKKFPLFVLASVAWVGGPGSLACIFLERCFGDRLLCILTHVLDVGGVGKLIDLPTSWLLFGRL